MTKIRPFLKWAGNKYQCIETIINSFPLANRLIEPFTGSGAVFINSNFQSYLLGEKNKDLINLFLCLQREGNNFIDQCEELFQKKNNCKEKYYQLRDEFNQSNDPRYKSAVFVYLNKHGYNGLCRYNQSGIYNVPFGLYKNPSFPRKEMLYFYQKSQNAEFLLGDFREIFNHAQKGDLIYCDPPYVPLSSSAYFSSYIDKKFIQEDQHDLVHFAKKSVKKGITVIISNHDTEFTRTLYQHSKIISFPVRRSISCLSQKRDTVLELLAIYS